MNDGTGEPRTARDSGPPRRARRSSDPVAASPVRSDRDLGEDSADGTGASRSSARERLRVASPETPHLEAIFDALTRARGVRTELVDDLRTQMADGGYLSREKLDLAIYRMLKDVLR